MVGGAENQIMSARETVLERVRRALGRAAGDPIAPLAAPRLRIPLAERNASTSLFVQNFEKLGGKSNLVAQPADVAAAIATILEGRRAVASKAAFLDACGITRLPEVQSGFADRDELRAACAAAEVGITSADYALADTGTIVLVASAAEARLISLLPPCHIAVFPRTRMLANIDELFGILPHPAEQTSSMVLITGPSRTADIEQILVRGVHGPGEIHAVIVG